MNILLDIDGVILNFDKVVIDYVKRYHNIDLDISAPSDEWDIISHPKIKHLHGEIWDFVLHDESAIYTMEEFPGAIEFLKELRTLGRVIACTSSVFPGTFSSNRAKYLLGKLGFDRKDIVFASDKALIKGDILIDDKPQNIVEWADANRNYYYGQADIKKALHFQTPGRASSDLIHLPSYPHNAKYCASYEDVLKIIKDRVVRNNYSLYIRHADIPPRSLGSLKCYMKDLGIQFSEHDGKQGTELHLISVTVDDLAKLKHRLVDFTFDLAPIE